MAKHQTQQTAPPPTSQDLSTNATVAHTTNDREMKVVRNNLVVDNKLIQKLSEMTESALWAYRTLAKVGILQKEDIKELKQEILSLKIIPSINLWDPERGQLSTWLYRIVQNHLIDNYRKKNLNVELTSFTSKYNDDGRTSHSSPIDLEVEELHHVAPENTYDKEKVYNLVHNSINELAPKYRSLVELRFLEEMSYEEIAEKLDLPIGTVKAQLFRAKDMLHAKFMNSPLFHELKGTPHFQSKFQHIFGSKDGNEYVTQKDIFDLKSQEDISSPAKVVERPPGEKIIIRIKKVLQKTTPVSEKVTVDVVEPIQPERSVLIFSLRSCQNIEIPKHSSLLKNFSSPNTIQTNNNKPMTVLTSNPQIASDQRSEFFRGYRKDLSNAEIFGTTNITKNPSADYHFKDYVEMKNPYELIKFTSEDMAEKAEAVLREKNPDLDIKRMGVGIFFIFDKKAFGEIQDTFLEAVVKRVKFKKTKTEKEEETASDKIEKKSPDKKAPKSASKKATKKKPAAKKSAKPASNKSAKKVAVKPAPKKSAQTAPQKPAKKGFEGTIEVTITSVDIEGFMKNSGKEFVLDFVVKQGWMPAGKQFKAGDLDACLVKHGLVIVPANTPVTNLSIDKGTKITYKTNKASAKSIKKLMEDLNK